jgi:DNA adenine methylase
MSHASPLRYPGGKGKLTQFIKLLLDKNDLHDIHYAELYAGGSGVALALLYSEYATRIYINDLDRAIFSFWKSVVDHTEELCRLVRNRPLSVNEWRRQRRVLARQDEASLLELGFAAFYLNRVNRSGIITGGLIGGLEQKGEWGVDARFNRAELIERIEKVARYRGRISVSNQDASDFLQRVVAKLPGQSLSYLDPPYYVKGQHRLYANYYLPKDHAKVKRIVAALERPWIVSYDATAEILELYDDYRRIVYGVQYSAADRYRGAEVMFFSPRMHVPRVKDPTSVGRKRRLAASI